MTVKLRGLKEEVRKVLVEALKAVDFDFESLALASPEEKEEIIFNAILSIIEEEDIPFIEWVSGMVEKEETDQLRDERGEFIAN